MTSSHNDAEAQIAQVLKPWLSIKIEGAEGLVIDNVATARAAGFSAETMFVDAHWRIGGKDVAERMVLRRQILGHDLTHKPDLAYQAQVMDHLSRQKLPAPVPRLIGLEPKSDLLGAPFLVMTRLPGDIVPQNPNYNLSGWVADLPVEKRAAIWENGVRALGSLQKIDWRNGFEFMARGTKPGIEGYVAWTEEWMRWAMAGRDFATGEAAIDYLKRAMPTSAPINVVWADGQPSNMLFNTKTGEVTGLLDWELALLGPSEIDLSWWLMFDELFSTGFHVQRLEGLPGPERLTAVFEEAAGRRVANMDYYGVLVRLHMAIITMRAVDRQVAHGRFKAQNDAWSHNPFTLDIAQRAGLAPVVISSDFADFNKMLMGKH